MNRIHCSTLLVLAMAVTGCAPVLLEKGPIAAIDVTRQARKPEIECSASWSPASGLLLQVAERQEVTLLRTARFHTLEWTGAWVWWAEPLELLASPVLLVLYGAAVLSGVFPPETSDLQVPAWSKALIVTAPLNPAATVLGTRLERRGATGGALFADPPVELRYQVRLPVPGLRVPYRVLGAGDSLLASGEALTDEAGEVRVPAVPVPPVRVVLELPGGAMEVVPETMTGKAGPR